MEGGDPASEAARARLIAWLGELGPRWGLPADACRIHGHLYLTAAAASEVDLAAKLGMNEAEVGEALTWLASRDLAQRDGASLWRTGADPWELVTTSLEHRRVQELRPALELLRTSRLDAARDPILARQIARLLQLVDDIAAIDAQARRLSPATLRTLLGAGGRVARLFGGAGR